MISFIPTAYLPKDVPRELLHTIDKACERVYTKILNLDYTTIASNEYAKEYFAKKHVARLHFSLESAAYILLWTLSKTNKPLQDTLLVEYGAGLGTLYLVAAEAGLQVVYNDIASEWCEQSKIMANTLGISIQEFVCGTGTDVSRTIQSHNWKCDIVASRNVIEHIPDYKQHISELKPLANPSLVIFDTTSANHANLLVRYYHQYLHHKSRPVFTQQRLEYIQKHFPEFSIEEGTRIAEHTQGYGGNNLVQVINTYKNNQQLPQKAYSKTNVCEPNHSSWSERLESVEWYKDCMESNGFAFDYLPGFWDTHYTAGWKNTIGKVINKQLDTSSDANKSPFIAFMGSM